jgi:chromate reductase
MRILAFAASLRAASLNRKLIQQAAVILRSEPGVELDLADFREFEMPIYDGDLEARDGIPRGGIEFIHRIQQADGLIIATPEYNGGIPGTLKNAIDWASRTEPIPFEGKPVLLIGASPGSLGAIRSLWHSRVPLETIGAHVYPEMFGLPRAHQAFDDSGALRDPNFWSRLQGLLLSYIEFVRKLLNETPSLST